MAQENRALSTGESDLRHLLKRKVIAVSVVERARKQCTRITNLKEEDANTRFFQVRVNARRRKKAHL
jgi:hypothetical protein